MIEAEDLENVRKVCDELVKMGYEEPRVTMFGATEKKSSFNLYFSKCDSQMQGEET